MVVSVETQMEEKSMVRGRRPKSVLLPTQRERSTAVRTRLVNLPGDLASGEFDASLPTPGVVKLIAPPVKDSKTGGWIGHVEESMGVFLQRVSVEDNFSQRPPFDHTKDSIYQRLIRDFIKGAAMPESKVAALGGAQEPRVGSLDAPGIDYSIIDGLQRQFCYGLALLLVWRREALVNEGLITTDAWKYFREPVEETGDIKTATEALLSSEVDPISWTE